MSYKEAYSGKYEFTKQVGLTHSGKWRAFNSEYVNGKLKQKHLGLYISEEDAYSAVLKRLEDLKEVEREEDLQLGECHSI